MSTALVSAATLAAQTLIADLSKDDSQLASTDIERQVGEVRELLSEAIDGLIETHQYKAVDAVYALQALAETLQVLGQKRIEEGALLVDYQLLQTMPVTLLAHLLYGDVERALDIHTHNTLQTPNQLPKGLWLRVPRA